MMKQVAYLRDCTDNTSYVLLSTRLSDSRTDYRVSRSFVWANSDCQPGIFRYSIEI